jgi:hypothetical protein
MDLSNAQAMGGENKTCKKCSSRGTGCMKDRMIAEVRGFLPESLAEIGGRAAPLARPSGRFCRYTPDPSRGYE